MNPREISKIEKICEKVIGIKADEMQVNLIYFNLAPYACISITSHNKIYYKLGDFLKNVTLDSYLNKLKIINEVFVDFFQFNLKTKFYFYLIKKREQLILKKGNLYNVMNFSESLDKRDIGLYCKENNDEFVNLKITDNNKYNLLLDKKITYFV